MKTFKILFAAVIIAGFATSAMAQNDITARAEVLAPIEITGQVDLDFLLVSQGTPKTIDLLDNVTGGAAQGDESTGRFRVEAGTGSNVSWQFSVLPEVLDNEDETETMSISYTAGWSNVEAGTDMQDDGVITQGGGHTVNSVEDGEFYVFLGGTVSPDAEQEAGIYTTEVTLTAEYN